MKSQQSCENQIPSCFQSKSSQQYSIKYSQLKNSLLRCDIDVIINLLIEELEKADKFQIQIKQIDSLLKLQQDEKQHLKISLQQKKVAFRQVCQTQQKNIQSIQRLQKQLCYLKQKFNLSKQQPAQQQQKIEKKYKQLSTYMNQYMRNTSDIQQQFKKNLFVLKNQNIRLSSENKSLQRSLNQQSFTIVALSKQSKNTEQLNQTIFNLKKQNQNLRDQMSNDKLIQRDVYEGIIQMQTNRQQIQKQLQNLKQQCQKTNQTNRQVTHKYQDLMRKFKEQQKQRQIISKNCKGSSRKIQQLENCIKKQNNIQNKQLNELKHVKQELQKLNLLLLSQVQDLKNNLNQSRKIIKTKTDQNSALSARYQQLKKKNKQLQKILQHIKLEKQNQQVKSDLICRQVQNFMSQPNITIKSFMKQTKDLSNIKSLKTMTTSSSQSGVQAQKLHNSNAQH